MSSVVIGIQKTNKGTTDTQSSSYQSAAIIPVFGVHKLLECKFVDVGNLGKHLLVLRGV